MVDTPPSERKPILASLSRKEIYGMDIGELTESPAGLQSQAYKLGRKNEKEAICPEPGPDSPQQSGEGKLLLNTRCSIFASLIPHLWSPDTAVTAVIFFVTWRDCHCVPE